MVEKNQIKMNSYFLKSEKTDINGRLYFEYVVLTIHKDTTEYQENYICWLEENINKNLDSAQNMPLVAQFMGDEKGEPLGHGYLTHRNGKAIMVDSEQVGSVVKAEVKDVDVDGKTIKALVATAYLNELRYPQLCQWLRATMFEGKSVATSVEIFAKKGQDSINSNNIVMDDVEICVPIDFDFGGSAILTITPADENAIVLEILNSRMMIEKTKEEDKMKLEEALEKIETLEVENKEIQESFNSLQAKFNSLEEEKNTVEADKAVIETEKTDLETKVSTLTEEITSLSEFKTQKENEALINDFEEKIADFEEDLKEEIKDDIEDFKQEPSIEKSEAVLNSLNALFVKKAKIAKETKKVVKEEVKLNSLFVSVETDDKETKDFSVWE